MNAVVSPHPLCGQLSAVGSKSFAHRALIAAALLGSKQTEIFGITPSVDVTATVGCLRALGATVQEGKSFVVTPPKEFPQKVVLNCVESGSTLRFFMPIVAALGIETTFCGSQRLLERPILPLVEVLQKSNIQVDGWRLSGKLHCGTYEIAANVSSQYVTGLLFALSLLPGESRLVLRGEPVSAEYVQITLDVLRQFGVVISKIDGGYKVLGGTKSTLQSYTVEGDWSNAAFPLVAGALGGDVTLCGLNISSCQGDRQILEILQQAGANVCTMRNSVRVCGGNLQSFSVCAENIPDAVPALSVLAAHCKGTSEIGGVERLRLKESDRLQGILDMLHSAQICAEYTNSVLKITGGKPHGGKFFANNDHRMAMSATVLALYAQGKSEICGAECVEKSYPNYYLDINKLGGGDCVLLERK